MKLQAFFTASRAATVALAGLCLYAAHSSLAAKPATKAHVSGVSATKAQALIAQYRCNSCHSADLRGKQGFSPSIRKTGALHDYTQAQFVTLMHTGKKNDGSMVRRPMPVYAKMPTAQADTIFAYLETQR